MNPKKLVKISNTIGIVAIVLLVYWVFVFITIQVFGLKVFRENLTESFYLSILGILALMTGALIINLMFNLTRIAQKHNSDITYQKSSSRKSTWAFVISFPLILALLFGGDYLSSRKKENYLIDSAKSIVKNNQEKINKITDYSFDKKWIEETEEALTLLTKTEKDFPTISVITKDVLDKKQVYLAFYTHYNYLNDTIAPLKKDYLLATNQEEKAYLSRVFEQSKTDIKFSADDGSYELYFPYVNNGKVVVFYFSDYQRYGKFGS